MRVDGGLVADRVLDELTDQIAASDAVPGCLGTLVVADDDLARRQAALKHRACERVGMRWRAAALPGDATTGQVLAALAELAQTADGIFVHLPLPAGVDAERVIAAVPPDKDIDGLRADSAFVAASAVATRDVLRAYDVPLADRDVVIVGAGSPLVRGLRRVLRDAAGTSATVASDGRRRARAADVVVCAAYRPGLVTGDWVRVGAAVVDAASGDVEVESVGPRAGLLCASPGGIGPVTVARLLTATRAAADGPLP